MKVMLAYLLAALGYGILLFVPDDVNSSSAVLFLISIFVLALSELFIAPIILSVIAQHSNPKYLAIMMSLGLLPSRLFSYGLMIAAGYLGGDGALALKLSTIIFAIFGVILLILYFVFRREKFFS